MTDDHSEISVSHYPGDKGILYRDLYGIIYKTTGCGVIVLGCDAENIGVISPINSSRRALLDENVILDDSLARECKPTGGLFASCFQSVGNDVTYIPINPLLVAVVPKIVYQPVGLFERVFDYIIKNQCWVELNLELLPAKIKNCIIFRLELNNKQDELAEIRHNSDTSIEKFEKSYLKRMAEIKNTHHQHIALLNNNFSMRTERLESDHFQTMEKMKGGAMEKELKILCEIDELEISVSKYS
uniref:Uncharacterized protein n=1 Tax=Pithovirus LCPAC202 TaxID=2506592 RepID=A0A481Z9B9_9VIRU|nr:MAG: hypothetical protein LCPAC202_02550 [Pithovirus LCPAC202]